MGTEALKGVNYARLPGLDFLRDLAIVEVNIDGDLAQSVKPSQLARLLQVFEAARVTRLQGFDFGGDEERF